MGSINNAERVGVDMAVSYIGPGFSGSSINDMKRSALVRRFNFASYRYFMRAYDSTGTLTMWIADCADPNGAQSTNVNKPFTNVVILSVKGSLE